MLDQEIEAALRSARPVEQLREFAFGKLRQGHEQQDVLAEFEQARQHLREAGREQDEDAVMDVMDMLVGWCSPHVKLSSGGETDP